MSIGFLGMTLLVPPLGNAPVQPSAPTALAITGESAGKVSTAILQLTWTRAEDDPVDGSYLYVVQVASDVDFNTLLVNTSDIDAATLTTSPVFTNGTLYSRVAVVVDGIQSPWSDVHSFNHSILVFSVTTSAPNQTLTLNRMTPAGDSTTVYWGDGNTSTINSGHTGTTTHQYASAGTYPIAINKPALFNAIDLQDVKLSPNFNANAIYLTGTLSLLRLVNLNIGWTVSNSAPFPSMATSATVDLNAITGFVWNVGSVAGANMPSSTLVKLGIISIGSGVTWNVGSVAGANMPSFDSNGELTIIGIGNGFVWNVGSVAGANMPSSLATLRLLYQSNLTWVVGSSAGANAPTVSGQIQIIQPGSMTWTPGAAGAAIPLNTTSFTLQIGMNNAMINAWADEMWIRRASFLKNATWNLAGNNAVASGTYQAQCPPTTAKEKFYELVNDSCAAGFLKQTITIN